jgi:hypothetical protein
MNTSLNLTREQFATFRTAYRQLAHRNCLTPADILIYNLLRGFPADRGFSPTTNSTKLSNGQAPWLGFDSAKLALRTSIRYGTLAARYGSALGKEQADALLSML